MRRFRCAVASALPLRDQTAPKKSATPLLLGGVGVLVMAGAVVAFVLHGSHPPDVPPKTPDVVTQPPVKTEPQAALIKHDPPPVVAPTGPLRVAVLKFKNVGNDAKLAPLEAGVGETAVTKLAGTKGVSLIERADLDSDIGELDKRGDVHFDAATVARAGQLKGIEVAVQGGFQRAGKEVRITARLVKVENGEILSTFAVTHSVHDLFGAQDALADGLLPKLKELARK